MIHDPELIEKLLEYEEAEFSGEAYRAVMKGADPLAPSANGGRWMVRGENSVLYTSLAKEGALAELCYHLGSLNPRPSRPLSINSLNVGIEKSIKLIKTDLSQLGVTDAEFDEPQYEKMQKIGAACCFHGIQGLIVPNARWDCENLILFPENFQTLDSISLSESSDIDWERWGIDNGLLE
jgi:hypothetical protein